MFDLSWSHILIFLVVALVVVGPKDLPRLMRIAGQWVRRARAMADQFRQSFDEMARQSELDELRQEIEALRNARPIPELDRMLDVPSANSILNPSTKPAVAVAPATTADTPSTDDFVPIDKPPEEPPPSEPVFQPGDKPPAP